MFGNLFKKKAPPPQTFDLPGMAPTEGLPLLQASLGLTRESWGVAENLPPKLSMLRMIVDRSDSEDELPKRLLRDPRAGIGAVESFDALTPYGQAIAMLLVSLGNYAGFLGSSTKAVVNNAVSHDAAELRSIMYVCRAYERYADDTLVWTPTVGVIQAFDSKVDSFAAPADFDADHAAMCDEILRLARHVRDLFVYHYRPTRMPNISTLDPRPKTEFVPNAILAKALAKRSR